MIKLEMKNYNMILTQRQKKYKYDHLEKYLISKEILPSDQRRVMRQAKFTYSPLGIAFGKQIKTTEDLGIKQVEALKALKPEENQELNLINQRAFHTKK